MARNNRREKSLEERAKERDIYRKAEKVARFFGSDEDYETDDDCGVSKYNFKNQDFQISYQSSVSSEGSGYQVVTVSYREKEVFIEDNRCLRLYVTGDWEAKLDKLYVSARRVKK